MSWDATDSPGMGRIQQSLQNQGLSAHHHQAATNSCGLRAVQRAGTDGRASPRLHRSRRCCHVLQVRRKTPGPTPSAPQAGNSSSAWTPSPAACKPVSSPTEICEQQEEKKHKASLFRTQGHCRTRGERRLAAGSKVPAEWGQISAGLGPCNWCRLCPISTSPSRGHIATRDASQHSDVRSPALLSKSRPAEARAGQDAHSFLGKPRPQKNWSHPAMVGRSPEPAECPLPAAR